MQLNEGFKRCFYWNQYKADIKSRESSNNHPLRILLDFSFQGVKRSFVLAFDNSDDDENFLKKNTVTENIFFQE